MPFLQLQFLGLASPNSQETAQWLSEIDHYSAPPTYVVTIIVWSVSDMQIPKLCQP